MPSHILRILLDNQATKDNRPYLLGRYQAVRCVHLVDGVRQEEDSLFSGFPHLLQDVYMLFPRSGACLPSLLAH